MKTSKTSSFSDCTVQHKRINKSGISSSRRGLRSVAGGLFSILVPNKSIRIPRSSTIRERNRKDRCSIDDRQVITPTKFNEVGGNNREPSLDLMECKELNENNPNIIPVPAEFLGQVLQALQMNRDSQKTHQKHQECTRKLATLKRRLRYFRDNTIEILYWMEKREDQLLRKVELVEPDLAELEELPGTLEAYDEQLALVEEAISSVEHQEVESRKKYDEAVADIEALTELILGEVLSLLAHEPMLTAENNFEIKPPMEARLMKIIESDCDEFGKHILQERAYKYPRRLTSDWHLHLIELELQQGRLVEAQVLLAELDKLGNCSSSGNESVLHQQRAKVTSAQEALADAVEGARYAGLRCGSDGSIIHGQRGISFVDDTPMDEDRDQYAEGDEMNIEELEQYLARGRRLTERWLSCTSFGVDPEEAGPITPCTPGTTGFPDDLSDLEAGDSISNANFPRRTISIESSDRKDRCHDDRWENGFDESEHDRCAPQRGHHFSSANLPDTQSRAWSC